LLQAAEEVSSLRVAYHLVQAAAFASAGAGAGAAAAAGAEEEACENAKRETAVATGSHSVASYWITVAQTHENEGR
jgi:hypothetical protein